jgi:hypothetical protein
MKTLFTLALAGALSFSSLAAPLADDDLMALSDVRAKFKKVNVLLREGVGEAKIALFDNSGKKLHQRKVKVGDSDIIIPYNLSQLPVGEYKIRISTDDEQVDYTVATFDKPIPSAQLPLMAYGKLIDDQTINLTVIGLEEPGVEVEIRYADTNKVLHSEYILEEEGFRKNYKLNGVSPEEVFLSVKDAKGRSKAIHFD